MVTPLRRISNRQLGEVLIERGLITSEQLDSALVIQKQKGGLIGKILVVLGYIKEPDVNLVLTIQKDLEKKGRHIRIGELLIERDLITSEQLEYALKIQKQKGGLIGEILVILGYIKEADVALALTSQYGFPYLPLESYEIDPKIIEMIPGNLARQYLLIPIDKLSNNLSIAMSNPLNNRAVDELESLVGCNIQIFVSTSSDIKKAIDKYYKDKQQG